MGGLAGRSRCVHGFKPLIPHHLPRSSTVLLVDILPLAAHSLVERYGILQPRHCFSIECGKRNLWWNVWVGAWLVVVRPAGRCLLGFDLRPPYRRHPDHPFFSSS